MSSLEISAMRKSRNVLDAAATAFFAASSHDIALVPITSVTRYTPSVACFFAMTPPVGGRAAARSDHTVLRFLFTVAFGVALVEHDPPHPRRFHAPDRRERRELLARRIEHGP